MTSSEGSYCVNDRIVALMRAVPVLLLASVTSLAAGAAAPGGSPPGRAVLVGTASRHYVDDSRRSWDGSEPRPLQTTLWYRAPESAGAGSVPASTGRSMFDAPPVLEGAPLAADQERYPLVLISHGTGGCAPALLWLGHALAAHGYIVAAVNHHGNTCGEAKLDARGFFLWWERAKDLSAVLDQLLQDPTFGPHIDKQRIGAAGFSLGGYTVITVAGGRIDRARYLRFCDSPERDFTCGPQPEFPQAPQLFQAFEQSDPVVKQALLHSGDSYRDPRIRAVFAMAPVFASGFASKDLADIHIPVEIVVGAGDTTSPPATNAERYASLIHGARLQVIPGPVGHYDFAPVCTEEGKKMIERICDDAHGVDRRAVQREVSAAAVEFFGHTLPSHSRRAGD